MFWQYPFLLLWVMGMSGHKIWFYFRTHTHTDLDQKQLAADYTIQSDIYVYLFSLLLEAIGISQKNELWGLHRSLSLFLQTLLLSAIPHTVQCAQSYAYVVVVMVALIVSDQEKKIMLASSGSNAPIILYYHMTRSFRLLFSRALWSPSFWTQKDRLI